MKKIFRFLVVSTFLMISVMVFSPAVFALDNPLEESEPSSEVVEGIMGDEDVSGIMRSYPYVIPSCFKKISDGHYSFDVAANASRFSNLFDEFEIIKSDLKDNSRIILYIYRNLSNSTIYFYIASFDKASFKIKPDSSGSLASSDSTRLLVFVLEGSSESYFRENTSYRFPIVNDHRTTLLGPDMSYFSNLPVLYLNEDIEQLSIVWPEFFAKVEYRFSDGTEAAPSVSEVLKKGETFSFASPSIEGYTPDHAVVSGTMDNASLTYRVVYTPNEYNLTIKYLYEDGSEALPPTSKKVAYKTAYNIPSPSIEGFSPDLSNITGTMDAKDISFTVIYTRKPLPLTVIYQYKDGSQASATVTQNINSGTTYRVVSPSIVGYVPDIPIVSGTMPENEVSVTVTYSPKISNLVIDYLFQDGREASPTLTEPFEYKQSYSISSPSISNCTPDIPTVSGVMGTEDVHVTVTYIKSDCRLTIKYQYENGRSASESYTGNYKPGDSYNIKSPEVKGYQPDKMTVSGVMPSDDLTIIVTYSQPPHTLSIHYHYEDGNEAAPSYTASVKYGNFFSVPSPTVPGFTPERSVISGKMGDTDATFTVIYKPTKYLLTIRYNRQSGKARAGGTKIAPDYTGRYMEGEKYEISSPSVIGYETQMMTVSGIMPAHDVIETVSYSLAGEPVVGDMTGLLDVVSSSGEYMRQYISEVLVTLITAGLLMFAGFMVIRFILYIINRMTRV